MPSLNMSCRRDRTCKASRGASTRFSINTRSKSPRALVQVQTHDEHTLQSYRYSKEMFTKVTGTSLPQLGSGTIFTHTLLVLMRPSLSRSFTFCYTFLYVLGRILKKEKESRRLWNNTHSHPSLLMLQSLLCSYTFWHTFLYVMAGTPKKEKASRRPSEGNGAAAAAAAAALVRAGVA